MDEEKETIHFPEQNLSWVIFGNGADASYYGHKPDYRNNKIKVWFRPSPFMRALHQIQEYEENPELVYMERTYDTNHVIPLGTHLNANRLLVLTDYTGNPNTNIILKINQSLIMQNRSLWNQVIAQNREIARLSRVLKNLGMHYESQFTNMASKIISTYEEAKYKKENE